MQALYKEDFEKNKGKGFSVVVDTPEMQRLKKTQDQISNVSESPLKGPETVLILFPVWYYQALITGPNGSKGTFLTFIWFFCSTASKSRTENRHYRARCLLPPPPSDITSILALKTLTITEQDVRFVDWFNPQG